MPLDVLSKLEFLKCNPPVCKFGKCIYKLAAPGHLQYAIPSQRFLLPVVPEACAQAEEIRSKQRKPSWAAEKFLGCAV